jgi:DEAD/DEAH box helicase
VAGVCRSLRKRFGVRSACVHGGVDAEPQVAALAKGPRIVVATPGRLLDLLDRGALSLGARTQHAQHGARHQTRFLAGLMRTSVGQQQGEQGALSRCLCRLPRGTSALRCAAVLAFPGTVGE